MRPISHYACLAASVAATFAASAAADAATIVSWGGDYVTADQNTQLGTFPANSGPVDLDADGSADDSRRHYGFSAGNANPAVGAHYNGTSATFFGGTETIKYNLTTDSGNVNLRVINGSTPAMDAIQITGGVSSNLGQTGLEAAAVLGWSDFMNVGVDEQVTYADLDSLLVRYGYGGVTGSNRTRFLLRDSAGGYYVSNTSFTGGYGASAFTLANLEAETWAAYDPAKSVGGDAGVMRPGALSFAPLSGDTVITATGILLHFTPGATGTLDAKVTNFAAEATPSPIPEPAAVSAVGLLGLTALRRRR